MNAVTPLFLAVPSAPATTDASLLWLGTFLLAALAGCSLLGFALARLTFWLLAASVPIRLDHASSALTPARLLGAAALWAASAGILFLLVAGGGASWPLLMRLTSLGTALAGAAVGYTTTARSHQRSRHPGTLKGARDAW